MSRVTDNLPAYGVRPEMDVGSYRPMPPSGSAGPRWQDKEAGVDFLGMDQFRLMLLAVASYVFAPIVAKTSLKTTSLYIHCSEKIRCASWLRDKQLKQTKSVWHWHSCHGEQVIEELVSHGAVVPQKLWGRDSLLQKRQESMIDLTPVVM